MEYGICHLGIIPLRNENNHRSEMVSQLLYGDCYKIIEKRKSWYKIRMHWDGYEGWIPSNQVYQIEKEIYSKTTASTPQISTDLINYITDENDLMFPIILGSNLSGAKTINHVFEGKTQAGKKGKEWLIKTAYMYLNAPYLWGGRSPMGIDCSGFTQMVYKINGTPLKRDASQQAQEGETLSFIEESEAGDLAFFDDKEGKITHVGLLLENHHIIHAHGAVRIDQIDQTGIFNSETQTHSHKLRMIKKMI